METEGKQQTTHTFLFLVLVILDSCSRIVSPMERRRIFTYIAITLNCLTAGSVFTFPLFSPPFARALDLTNFQTSAVVSSAILGQYASAVLWGSIGDTKGPGVLSLYAAVLYGGGYGLLGWRYIASVQMEEVGRRQWIWLSFYYFVVGCATSASYFVSCSSL